MGGGSASMSMGLGYRNNAYAGRIGFGQPVRRALHTMLGHGPTQAQMSMGNGYGMTMGTMAYGGMGLVYASPAYSAGTMPSYSVARQTLYAYNGVLYDRLPIVTRVWDGAAYITRSYDGVRWTTVATAGAAAASDTWGQQPMSGDSKPVTQADLRALEDRITARQDRTDAAIRNLVPAQLPPDVLDKMKGIEDQLKRLIPAPQKGASDERREQSAPEARRGGLPSDVPVVQGADALRDGQGQAVPAKLQVPEVRKNGAGGAALGGIGRGGHDCVACQAQPVPVPPASPVDALAARVKSLKASVDALTPLYLRVVELEGQAKTLIDLSSQLDAIQLRLNQLSRPALKAPTSLPPPQIQEKQSPAPAQGEVVRVRYQDAPVAPPVFVAVKKE